MGRGTIRRRADGGGVKDAGANYPSTMLRMVPLPIAGRWGGTPDSLHHQRVDDHLRALVPIAEAAAVEGGEGGVHRLDRRNVDFEGGVAAGGPEPRARVQLDALGGNVLFNQR